LKMRGKIMQHARHEIPAYERRKMRKMPIKSGFVRWLGD
jgi:hypothetical protein